MTPKEKADELVQTFIDGAYSEDCEGLYTPIAKKASLIAVNLILSDSSDLMHYEADLIYWQEVKQEIEKL